MARLEPGMNPDPTDGQVDRAKVLGLEEGLRLVIDDVEDCTVLALDVEGTIVSCSSGFERLQPEPLLGRHFRCLYPPEDIERNQPEQDLAACRRDRLVLTGYRVRPDGRRFWAEAVLTPLLDPALNVRSYALVIRDLSASREARQLLTQLVDQRRDFEAVVASHDADLRKLATVAQLTDNSVVITDSSGHVEWVNESFTKLTGYTLEEAVGRKPSSFLQGPLTDPATIALMHERLSQGEGFKVELFNYGKSSEYWLAIEVQPVHDATGTLRHFIALQRNISEQYRAEQVRKATLEREQQARRQAEAINRLKDDFLATVSHELRTPLNGMLGFAKLLRRGSLQPEVARKALEAIERNAEAQARLIEDLLDVSTLAAGLFTLYTEPVELVEVVTAVLATLQPAAEAKRIRIFTKLDPTGPISGDRRRLQQVVWNVLFNAIKFTPAGGSIELSLCCVDASVELAVTDTGIGIGDEFLPHVFDRFRQADNSSTRIHGGLGLGLSLVRQLVELHGGTVSVQSAGHNQGTTFKVRLPRLSVPSAPAESTLRAIQPALPDEVIGLLLGLRVVLVDADPETRLAIEQVAARCGAEVTTVATTDEAAAVLERWPEPDVLVLDLGSDTTEQAYELLGRLREQQRVLPVLAMTATADTRDRTRAFLAGVGAYLYKPADPVELVALIASLARRGRL